MTNLSTSEHAVHPPVLTDRHRNELRASGLTDETISRSGIYSASGPGIAKLLGWNDKFNGSGYVIPFGDGYFRVKLDKPRQTGDGKTIKYESPRKKMNRAYLPPGFAGALARGGPLVITEGEKKALAIAQLGHAVIGLVGVWGWQRKRPRTDQGKAYGRRQLIPQLAAIDWKNREVIICFDSDAASKPQVQLAQCKLSEVLSAEKASIRVSKLPAVGEGKTGADDFIVARGEEAFRKLLDGAEEAETPPAPSPMDYARLYIQEHHTTAGGITLRWHRDEFWKYSGVHYEKFPNSDLETLVFEWLDRLISNAKPHHANAVIKALQSVCYVPFDIEPPANLSSTGDLHPDVLVFRNGIVSLNDAIAGKPNLKGHAPEWFSTFSLPYDYDPNATCDTWFTTLNEIFDGNLECVDLLGEWFGYCLTEDTSLHAIMLLEGPPRSGKGTVLRTLQQTVGAQNCVNPRLTTLGETFGLWGLVGKRLAICPDAHLGRTEKAIGILEVLKLISGEDSIEVHRKHLPPISTRLKTRFVLACNELPEFGDYSNALGPRLLILPFRNSFQGRENRDLEAELRPESPGIVRWALEGLERLRRNKRFTLPRVSQAIAEDFGRLTSPIRAFLEDCCELNPALDVARDEAWKRWTEWCEKTNNKKRSREWFGSSVRPHVPGFDDTRPRIDGVRERRYVGFRLK